MSSAHKARCGEEGGSGRGKGGGHLLFMSCCSRSRSRSSPGAWLWRRRSSGDGSPQGLPCSHSLAASNHHTKSNQTVFISHFKRQKQNVPQSARQKNKNMKQKCNPAGRRLCVAPWRLTGVPGVCRGRIRGTGAGARSHGAGGETGLRQQHTQDDITSCTWPQTAAVARGRHAHSRSLSVLAQSEAGEACL